MYIRGIGMMIGLIFGAGIFAMPAAVARAGIGWGSLHFIVAFMLMLVIQLWFAEIAFLTKKRERFTGFVRRWLGEKAGHVAFISVIVGYYGGFLAYGVLGGIFLSQLFPVFSPAVWSFIFFGVSGVLTLFSFKEIGAINFYLTIPLVGFLVVLGGLAIPHMQTSHFGSGDSSLWFLPYGIFIFAFSGLAVIPETSDIMKRLTFRDMRNVIFISMGVTALLYLIFIITVVGVTGSVTTDDALSGLVAFIGREAIIIGAIIGFLAVLTSYISLAADMKNIFYLDYNIPPALSWTLSVLPAPVLFFLGFAHFLQILSFVGAVVFGVSGILIFLMARNFHKAHPEHRHALLSTKNPFSVLVLVFLIAGVLLELLQAGGVL